jgi:aspartate/methionine/tyrosine aminotransferase
MKISKLVQNLPYCGIQDILSLGDIPNIIDMGIGSPHFTPSSNIIDAACQAAKMGTHKYSEDMGFLELRKNLANKIQRENGFEIDPEKNVIITAGTSPAIYSTLLTCVDPGDEIIIPTPAYFAYDHIIRMVGGEPIHVVSHEDDLFIPSQDNLAEAITPKTQLIIINTPCNPTGAVWEKSDLEMIADLSIDHDILVMADELYEKFVYDSYSHYSIAAINDMTARTITIGGLSKSHSLAGYRIGWVIGPEEFIKSYLKLHQQIAICAPVISQAAALEALRSDESFVNMIVQEFEKNRDIMWKRLNNDVPLITAIKPKGNLFIFANIQQLIDEHLDDMVAFIHSDKGKSIRNRISHSIDNRSPMSLITTLFLAGKANVLPTPGNMFGLGGDGYLRFSLAQTPEKINEALDRIIAVLE